jgi:hypothetical protein
LEGFYFHSLRFDSEYSNSNTLLLEITETALCTLITLAIAYRAKSHLGSWLFLANAGTEDASGCLGLNLSHYLQGVGIVDDYLIAIPAANINILAILGEFRVNRTPPWLEGGYYFQGISVKDNDIVPIVTEGNINPDIAAFRMGTDE